MAITVSNYVFSLLLCIITGMESDHLVCISYPTLLYATLLDSTRLHTPLQSTLIDSTPLHNNNTPLNSTLLYVTLLSSPLL